MNIHSKKSRVVSQLLYEQLINNEKLLIPLLCL